MKNLSWWAWCHPRTARTLAIFLNVMLLLFFVIFGFWLYVERIEVPTVFLALFSGLILLLVVTYPKRKQQLNQAGRQQYYWSRMKHSFGIYLLLFAVSCSFGNRLPAMMEQAPAQVTTAHGVTKKMQRQYKRQTRKDLRKQVRAKIKEMRKKDGLSPGWKFTLWLLAAIVAFCGALALAALSCALSCAGNSIGALAAALAAGGAITGGVFLIIAGVRALRSKY